jgi:hypothetical protein
LDILLYNVKAACGMMGGQRQTLSRPSSLHSTPLRVVFLVPDAVACAILFLFKTHALDAGQAIAIGPAAGFVARDIGLLMRKSSRFARCQAAGIDTPGNAKLLVVLALIDARLGRHGQSERRH